MEPPVINRHRRPFLAPIWLAVLVAAVVFGILIAGYRSLTTTTIIVTRHAENVLGTIADAPLTPEGEQRSQQLARTFGATAVKTRIDAIYIINSRSASQTAAPLASRLGIRPIMIRDSDVKGLASRLLRAHRGRAVLVVVRADAVMRMVRDMSHVSIPVSGENDYGSAYVVSVPSVGRGNVVEIKY